MDVNSACLYTALSLACCLKSVSFLPFNLHDITRIVSAAKSSVLMLLKLTAELPLVSVTQWFYPKCITFPDVDKNNIKQ